jgi:ABC-type nitrate/sulfonate/bicarbonate transport system substrate-binding protein
MANKKSLIALWFLLARMTSVSAGSAAVQLDSLTVGYSSFSGHYTPVWIAVEDRLGRKYGLDLKVVYAGRMRPQQLLVSGEIPIVIATGSGALTSHILGVKDQVIVANFIDKVGGGIYARSEIKRPEDLRGKTVGVGRAGSISDSTVEMEQVPYPSLQVITSGLDILSFQYPQAKQTDPNLIFDPSFVRRIDQSGFIAGLYKK